MDARAEELLAFWFGPLDAHGLASDAHVGRWFEGGPGFDQELARRFGALHAQACAGALDAWARAPRGRLALVAEAPPHARERFASFLDYAVRHRDVIARFGRFPHRNAALGRTTTEEERTHLAQEGGF
jgi:uncharacterized protein (DUF924 family)